MASENSVILTVCIGNSVSSNEHYYRYVEGILEKVKLRLAGNTVICWSTQSFAIQLSHFRNLYIRRKNTYGGANNPQCMVSVIEKIARIQKFEKFELIITTDGQFNGSLNSFRDKLQKSNVLEKLANVRIFFIGFPINIEVFKLLKQLHTAFEYIPVTILINGEIYEYHGILKLWSDEKLLNFKAKNVPILIERLTIELNKNPDLRVNKIVVRELLDVINVKYLALYSGENFQLENQAANNKATAADCIRDLLAERNIDKLREFYITLFKPEQEDWCLRKIRKLYNLLNTDDCSDCYESFTVSPLDLECIRQYIDSAANEEDDSRVQNNYERLCAVHSIESRLPVMQLQKVQIGNLLESTMCTSWLQQRQLTAACPFVIFHLISQNKLSATVLSDHLSADAFLSILNAPNVPATHNEFTFSSTCITEAYGILIYNFTIYNEHNIDLYEDRDSPLYGPKNEVDDNIVNHLCCIVADYFFDTRELQGNQGLWAISLLYLIYDTDRIRSNKFLESCIRHTIIRISLVYDCNLTIFSKAYPEVKVSIHDALLCAVNISSTVCDAGNCLFCIHGVSSMSFVKMMKSIFNQDIPDEILCDSSIPSLEEFTPNR